MLDRQHLRQEVDDTGVTTAVKSKCEAEKAANLMQEL